MSHPPKHITRRELLERFTTSMIVTDKLVKRNEWNSYEIRCEGKRIRLAINGTQTVDFTEEDDKIPQFGIIAVQIHGGPPSEAWYRNFVLEELP